MELIALRIVLTLICVSILFINIRVVPTNKIEAVFGIGSSLILGACFAGIWLWF